jgi:light-regulated signal transduction histidine kinase (bacteriophytochrome)/ActR/RegA family two-component response regulator
VLSTVHIHNAAKPGEDLLAVCDREPIHLPDGIQPHGALIAADLHTRNILSVSGNVEEWLGFSVEQLLSMNLSQLTSQHPQLQTLLEDPQDDLVHLELNRSPVTLSNPLDHLVCEVHQSSDSKIILEFERHASQQDLSTIMGLRLQCMRELAMPANESASLSELLETTSKSIRKLTGYDRVMVYQLDEVGHGAIVAESRESHLEEFLGMHFPASDIPKQARSLYLKNRVRILTDINYQMIPLVYSDEGVKIAPIDLSLSHLRSMSPIHVEYLQNMGVSATLVLSIIIEGRLWGLIACHHYSPKHIDSCVRNVCEELAHFVSIAIRAAEQSEMRQASESAQTTILEIEKHVGHEANWLKKFVAADETVLQLMEVDGIVICDQHQKHSIGAVPDASMIDCVRMCLKKSEVSELATTRSLSQDFPELNELSKDFCGCVMANISKQPAVDIVLFRQEVKQTVDWAGDPRKQVDLSQPNHRLSPRKSFEKWCQEVEGNSLAWSTRDIYRTKALARFISARKIEESNRNKSQFLANMSHEIRTPMTAILGYVDVLTDSSPDVLNDLASAEAIHTIRRNGNHLLQLINDILDLSKMDAGKLEVVESDCSARDLVAEVISTLDVVAEKKKINLQSEVDSGVPDRFKTAPMRARQILLNLVGNAIKFCDRGTVLLSVHVDPFNPLSLHFLVSDTGPGMALDQQKHLFQPFFQAAGNSVRRHGGTGLGLAISRELARQMGGDVQIVSSEIGIGTTVRLHLPRRIDVQATVQANVQANVESPKRPPTQPAAAGLRRASQSGSEAASSEKAPLANIKILLAEDGVDNQRLIAFYLKKSGSEPTIVENGLLALEAFEHSLKEDRPFDIILMDMQMPIMDGYSATSEFRHRRYHVPIVALTAHALTEDRDRCLQAGCTDYVTKPVDQATLERAILDNFSTLPAAVNPVCLNQSQSQSPLSAT